MAYPSSDCGCAKKNAWKFPQALTHPPLRLMHPLLNDHREFADEVCTFGRFSGPGFAATRQRAPYRIDGQLERRPDRLDAGCEGVAHVVEFLGISDATCDIFE